MIGDEVTELRVVGGCGRVTALLDRRLRARQRMDRRAEEGGAEEVVRVVVRDVEAADRLVQRLGVVDNLLSERQTVLGVDRDQLRRQLDQVGVHRGAQIRRRVRVDRDVVTEGGGDGALHDQLLAKRLKSLAEAGVIERRRYSEHPPRFEYHATQAGEELRPVLMLLNSWGARWRPDSPQTEEVFLHDCGAPLDAQVVCASCELPVTA